MANECPNIKPAIRKKNRNECCYYCIKASETFRENLAENDSVIIYCY